MALTAAERKGGKGHKMAFYNRFKRNKYGNSKVLSGGKIYDSKAEARRGAELEALASAGEITGLRRQVSFELIPAQREPDTIGKRGGTIRGRLLERAVNYVADFVYINRDGDTIVEDVKGMRTPEYILKRKLMLYVHGIRVREIGGKNG